MPETLVIGLGAAGVQVCRRLAERIASNPGAGAPSLLWVDTDQERLQAPQDLTAGAEVKKDAVFLTATAALMDAAYRSPERFHAEWIDPEVLRGRGSVQEGTGGSRMLGRFLLL